MYQAGSSDWQSQRMSHTGVDGLIAILRGRFSDLPQHVENAVTALEAADRFMVLPLVVC